MHPWSERTTDEEQQRQAQQQQKQQQEEQARREEKTQRQAQEQTSQAEETQFSIPRHFPIDQRRPRFDSTRQRRHVVKSRLLQDGSARKTADAMMAVHNHERSRWRLDFFDSRRQLPQRDKHAIG
jgi:hypothetical protein